MHHPSDQRCYARAVIHLPVHTHVCVIQAKSPTNNHRLELQSQGAGLHRVRDICKFGGILDQTIKLKSRVDSQRVSVLQSLPQSRWGSHRVIISCSRRSLHQPPTQDSSHDPSEIRLFTMIFTMVPGGQEASLSGEATIDKLAEAMYANDKKYRASISRPAKATKKVHDYMPPAVVSAF